MKNFVITVAQQKGGAGKTTIAAHLAVILAKAGCRVAVIDIDPQGSFSKWYKTREQNLGEDYTGISLSTVTGWRLSGEIARLKTEHDIIIIDSPPHVQTEARAAIRHADMVLIPVQPSPLDLWATQATVDYAKSENVKTHIVMNRVNVQSRIFHAIHKELQNSRASVLGNRVLFASAILEGLGVSEAAPNSIATKEIQTLASDILNYREKDIKLKTTNTHNIDNEIRITELT